MLNRTRAKYLQNARLSLYRVTGIAEALELEETRTLEQHMGFHGQWEEHRRFQLDFAKRLGLVPNSRFIEIGCGPLTLGLPMMQYLDADRYTGIDVRPEVLNLSWQQVGKAGLSAKNPRLVISQSFGAQELPDCSARPIHQPLAFLRRGERPTVGSSVPAGHPLAHRRDRRVDHLRPGRSIEPRPLRPDPREAVSQ